MEAHSRYGIMGESLGVGIYDESSNKVVARAQRQTTF
jgi:hypothetical protein